MSITASGAFAAILSAHSFTWLSSSEGCRGLAPEPVEHFLEGCQDEVILVAESVIERHRRNPSALGKNSHLQALIASFSEQVARTLEYPPSAVHLTSCRRFG